MTALVTGFFLTRTLALPAPPVVFGLTALAMLAFAGNSLLCRLALRSGAIDADTFTTLRLLSGAGVLALLAGLRREAAPARRGDWASAVALFVYAAAFSHAYVSLPAGTGALLLFGAVQLTMIGWGLARGERMRPWQAAGFIAACAGLGWLLLPGASAPAGSGAALMLSAGVAWAVYSLRGRRAGPPLPVTAGNFWRAALIALALSAWQWRAASFDATGLACALASGALTSGVGYAIWYAALPGLKATEAASVQLTVPVIAALGAALLLGEGLSLRLVGTSLVVLGGVAIVIIMGAAPATPRDKTT